MTETTAPALSSTSCAILASDFSKSTADVLRHRWTLGKMSYLIDALAGQPVVVIVDKQTGSAQVGVRLVRAYRDGVGGDRVVIEYDGRQTAFRIANIGETIIPLGEDIATKSTKWIALELFSKDSSAAIRKAQAEHGKAEGRSWGRWKADVDTAVPGRSVRVKYEPITSNPAFADEWGTPWWGDVKIGE